MDCNTPGFPVYHQLLELAQTHVHQVGDKAVQTEVRRVKLCLCPLLLFNVVLEILANVIR